MPQSWDEMTVARAVAAAAAIPVMISPGEIISSASGFGIVAAVLAPAAWACAVRHVAVVVRLRVMSSFGPRVIIGFTVAAVIAVAVMGHPSAIGGPARPMWATSAYLPPVRGGDERTGREGAHGGEMWGSGGVVRVSVVRVQVRGVRKCSTCSCWRWRA